MKIEITEAERHFLLDQLANSREQRRLHQLHGRDVDKQELYQKVLNPPEPTYWVEHWIDYEGGYRAAEGTKAEVIEFLKKQKSYDIEDMTVYIDEGSTDAQEFLNAHMPK